jgi:DNA repair protein RAD5
MEDTDMPDALPPGLFFDGSDEEGELPVVDNAKSSSLPPASSPRTSASRSSPPSHLLFLEDSDDENSMHMSPTSGPEKAKRPIVIEDEDLNIQIMKHSQVSTEVKSNQYSRPTSFSPKLDKKTLPGPVAKKRRLLPPEHESPPNLATEFLPNYLGEVIIPNAWSNVSGKGYVKPNETILVKREEQDLPQAGKSKPKPGTVQSGKKKQISIATMLKPQPAKTSKFAKKKTTNNIVRLVNNKGFGDHRFNSPVSPANYMRLV